MHDPSDPGAITHVAGIEVGHHSDSRRPTGCTVVMARAGAVAGVDVRGAAPGTRGITRVMRDANCFIVLPEDSGPIAAGQLVRVEPFAEPA